MCDRFGNDQSFFGSADAIRSQSPTKHASNKSDEHRQEKSSADPAIMETPIKSRVAEGAESTLHSGNMHGDVTQSAQDEANVTVAKPFLPNKLGHFSPESGQQADSDCLDLADISLLDILER